MSEFMFYFWFHKKITHHFISAVSTLTSKWVIQATLINIQMSFDVLWCLKKLVQRTGFKIVRRTWGWKPIHISVRMSFLRWGVKADSCWTGKMCLSRFHYLITPYFYPNPGLVQTPSGHAKRDLQSTQSSVMLQQCMRWWVDERMDWLGWWVRQRCYTFNTFIKPLLLFFFLQGSGNFTHRQQRSSLYLFCLLYLENVTRFTSINCGLLP